MLEDRDYMRAPSHERRWTLTTLLLAINAAIFVLQSVVGFYVRSFPLDDYFALSIAGLAKGCLWQIITFQFMHAGVWHLLGNLMAIYFFGPAIEQSVGPKRFMAIYLGGGVLGGLLQLTASLLLPGHFGVASVMGASAGAFGLVAAFATLHPNRSITLLLFFVLPVSLQARYLLLFEVLLALYGIVVPFGRIAHVAHLGGILVGIGLSRRTFAALASGFPRRQANPLRRPRRLEPARMARTSKALASAPEMAARDLPPTEFISKEVDPILDKISAHGIQSLTPHERRILEAASSKIKRR